MHRRMHYYNVKNDGQREKSYVKFPPFQKEDSPANKKE